MRLTLIQLRYRICPSPGCCTSPFYNHPLFLSILTLLNPWQPVIPFLNSVFLPLPSHHTNGVIQYINFGGCFFSHKVQFSGGSSRMFQTPSSDTLLLCFIKKICYWTSTQQIITRGILWRDIWNSSDEIVLSSDEKCWLPDVLLAWHTAWKVPAADNFLSCACGAGRKGRSPFCWINKSIIKSELIKDKGVESGRVQ